MTQTETKVFIFIAEQAALSPDEAVLINTIAEGMNMSRQDADAAVDALDHQGYINRGVQDYVRLNAKGRRLYASLTQ